jgi:hypothetical protein
VQGYNRRYVAVGFVLIIVYFLFAFPFVGHALNKQYANVTSGPVDVTGLSPQDPLSLLVFAILFIGGTGLLIKGFR